MADALYDALASVLGYDRDDGEVAVFLESPHADTVVLAVHGFRVLEVEPDGKVTAYEHPTMYGV